MQTIPKKIKNIRELRNFTQEYMAQQLGMTQAGYSRIESGKTDVSLSQLNKIAEVLEVSLEDLLTFDNQKFFNSFNNVKDSINGFSIKIDSAEIKKLYEDKICLLEKLLKTNEEQLERYKDRFGNV